MLEMGWPIIVGGGAFGWALATTRRLNRAQPLFPGEKLSAYGLLIVSIVLMAIGLMQLLEG